jgi:hypothetical protein
MMPIRYERDDARRRVVVIVQGTLEPDDAFAVIEAGTRLWRLPQSGRALSPRTRPVSPANTVRLVREMECQGRPSTPVSTPHFLRADRRQGVFVGHIAGQD